MELMVVIIVILAGFIPAMYRVNKRIYDIEQKLVNLEQNRYHGID